MAANGDASTPGAPGHPRPTESSLLVTTQWNSAFTEQMCWNYISTQTKFHAQHQPADQLAVLENLYKLSFYTEMFSMELNTLPEISTLFRNLLLSKGEKFMIGQWYELPIPYKRTIPKQ